jgi:hypothetical protein
MGTVCRQWNFMGGLTHNSSVLHLNTALDTIIPLIWVLDGILVGLYTRTQDSCFQLNEK